MAIPKERLKLWQQWEFCQDIDMHTEGQILEWMKDYAGINTAEEHIYESVDASERTLALVEQAYKVRAAHREYGRQLENLENMIADEDDEEEDE